MSELWKHGLIQSFVPAHSESRLCATSKDISIATSLLPARPDLLLPAKPASPLPAKPDPPPPACSQRSQFHPYQRRQIHRYQLAASEATSAATSEACFTPTSKAGSTTNSLLPAKSDCQRGKLLLAKPVSPLPAKTDPPLPACSARGQIYC